MGLTRQVGSELSRLQEVDLGQADEVTEEIPAAHARTDGARVDEEEPTVPTVDDEATEIPTIPAQPKNHEETDDESTVPLFNTETEEITRHSRGGESTEPRAVVAANNAAEAHAQWLARQEAERQASQPNEVNPDDLERLPEGGMSGEVEFKNLRVPQKRKVEFYDSLRDRWFPDEQKAREKLRNQPTRAAEPAPIATSNFGSMVRRWADRVRSGWRSLVDSFSQPTTGTEAPRSRTMDKVASHLQPSAYNPEGVYDREQALKTYKEGIRAQELQHQQEVSAEIERQAAEHPRLKIINAVLESKGNQMPTRDRKRYETERDRIIADIQTQVTGEKQAA